MSDDRWDAVSRINEDRGFHAYKWSSEHPIQALVAGIVAFLVTAFVVLGVISVIRYGAWSVDWWFTSHNAQRTDRLYQQGVGNQSSLRQDIGTQLGVVLDDNVRLDNTQPGSQAATDLKANRYQVVTIICSDAAQLVNPLPSAQEQSFVSANCLDGNVNPDSKYAH